MSKHNNRLNQLIEILRIRSYVSIKELAKLLEVSEMTVRRDLKILEDSRVAENIAGKAVYDPSHPGILNCKGYSLSSEAEKRIIQKNAIGKYAASMVAPGDIIIIDTGTTTVHLAANLPPNNDITALCYNINILMEIRRIPGLKMIFSGGFYYPNTQMFTCDEGIQFIKGIRAQKVFVSAAGVHTQLGVTCANGYEVPTKKAILGSAVQKILLADSGKFDAVESAYFCDLNEINDIVTDSGIPEKWAQMLEGMGINLHVV